MLYDSIKILHILSATCVVTSMGYSFYVWCYENAIESLQRIQAQTGFIIVPFALVQLMTGFTMMSLKHESFSALWIQGSVIGFILAIGSWLGFVYFLLSANKRLQTWMLGVCALALLSMIFFMANKL